MTKRIGIRRDDKNQWEARVPLTPKQVAYLKREHGIETWIQPSEIRTFPDDAYREAGAEVREDISDCPVTFGVKEMPASMFEASKCYVFFAHVIKGQPYNMDMLQHMMDTGGHLVDYERIVDEHNRRLIFFGRFAGMAGMMDSLWLMGQRLQAEGIENPLSAIKQTYAYDGWVEMQKALADVSEVINEQGLPEALTPMVCGIVGDGNVSRGAQEVLSCLPHINITPAELLKLEESGEYSKKHIYQVVFQEEDWLAHKDDSVAFERQAYYGEPAAYKSTFNRYLPSLDMLINAIYWDPTGPRLIEREAFRKWWLEAPRSLRVIGDLSCDIGGGVELTEKATQIDNPSFIYHPKSDSFEDGVYGEEAGPSILAVDNLPCEMPKDASEQFGEMLLPFVAGMVDADFSKDLEETGLPEPIQRALIVKGGELMPAYHYLREYLPKK